MPNRSKTPNCTKCGKRHSKYIARLDGDAFTVGCGTALGLPVGSGVPNSHQLHAPVPKWQSAKKAMAAVHESAIGPDRRSQRRNVTSEIKGQTDVTRTSQKATLMTRSRPWVYLNPGNCQSVNNASSNMTMTIHSAKLRKEALYGVAFASAHSVAPSQGQL